MVFPQELGQGQVSLLVRKVLGFFDALFGLARHHDIDLDVVQLDVLVDVVGVVVPSNIVLLLDYRISSAGASCGVNFNRLFPLFLAARFHHHRRLSGGFLYFPIVVLRCLLLGPLGNRYSLRRLDWAVL